MTNRNVCTLTGDCTGCGACIIACPVNAISCDLNNEGFFTSKVNSTCINCGKCTQVCLKAGVTGVLRLIDGIAVAAQSINFKTIKSCTSGGVAYELSLNAIQNGMMVAGVIYDYKTDRAKTIIAITEKELDNFKGSKYIQSYTPDAFSEMIQIAKSDKSQRFLVIGTPCQIFGFASLIEQLKMRNQFVLVDLFCHGVPSYLVWDSYLESLNKKLGNVPLASVVFRDKTIGWHNFVMQLSGSIGYYKESSEGDLFYHAFFDNVLFSKSCFDCPVRKEYSKADIRLGDYWGKRYLDREDGVSIVLLLTPSGEKLLRDTSSVCVLDITSVEEALLGQSIHTYATLPLRDNAIHELQVTRNLKSTIQHYRRRFTMKIRVKLVLKEYTAHLPNGIRAKLRSIYKKL